MLRIDGSTAAVGASRKKREAQRRRIKWGRRGVRRLRVFWV